MDPSNEPNVHVIDRAKDADASSSGTHASIPVAHQDTAAVEHPHHAHPSPPGSPTRTVIRAGVALLLLGGMMGAGIRPRLQQQHKLQAMAQTEINTAVPVDVAK